jgi:hypothetical protein
MRVGKLLIILRVLAVLISIWHRQYEENHAEEPIIVRVLIRCLLQAERSSYRVSDGVFL